MKPTTTHNNPPPLPTPRKKARRGEASVRKLESDLKHPAAAGTVAAEVLGGAAGGAAIGTIAGPAGTVAGAVIGAAVAAAAGIAAERSDTADAANDKKLDDEIGVGGEDLGAPNLEHPPARTGAYSGASAGTGGYRESAPDEGPIPQSDE